MRFGILGPVEVADDQGRPLALGGPKQRAVLAILLLNANELVSSGRLIDELWGDRAPATAAKTLRVYVSNLRKALGEGILVTCGGGYVLQTETAWIDAGRFQSLLAAGHGALHAADALGAWEALREALGLWRGPPLADFTYEPFAQSEIARLEEARLGGLEDRFDADLILGEHGVLVGDLEALVSEHPLRERLQAQLMLALYRSGRQAEALEAYRRARAYLNSELGLEPGPELRALQAAILDHDASLAGPTATGDALVGEPIRAEPTAPSLGLLPARTERVIGREREIAELTLLLADPDVALVTLTGTGGTGKTTLALEVARQASSHFSDGAHIVWLASVTTENQVWTEMARALGVELSAKELVSTTIAHAIGPGRRLLVLDNFEHVLAAAPALSRLVGDCPRLKVLVTSRAPLRISRERVYGVTGLAGPSVQEAYSTESLRLWPASALFVERARAADSSFALTSGDDATAVADLCRYLDGLPLALELAAARAAILSPAQILQRLRTSTEQLGPGRRDAPERQRTLQATIDWSLGLLAPNAQRLFVVLGVFVGSFTVEAVEAVTADGAPSVVDELALLLDHGLIDHAPAGDRPRLKMLEPIRDVARERLGDRDDYNACVLRHAEYYATVAVSAEAALRGDRQLECLQRLDADVANFRAVLSRATSQPVLDLALQVTSALLDFWYLRDLSSDARTWLSWALGRPAGEPSIRARALYALGVCACVDGHFAESTHALKRCLGLCREPRDVSLIALCEAQLAFIHDSLGNADTADATAERAHDLAAEAHDTWTQATVLMLTGGATRNYPAARARYQQALALFETRNDRIWPPLIRRNLSYAAILAGDYSYARRYLEQAIIDVDSVKLGKGRKASLEGDLGVLDLLEGHTRAAHAHVSRALVAWRSIGDRQGEREMLMALAALATAEQEPNRAVALVSAAHAAYDGPLARIEEILLERYLPELPNEQSAPSQGARTRDRSV